MYADAAALDRARELGRFIEPIRDDISFQSKRREFMRVGIHCVCVGAIVRLGLQCTLLELAYYFAGISLLMMLNSFLDFRAQRRWLKR